MLRITLLLFPCALFAAEAAEAAEASPSSTLIFITGTLLPLAVAGLWYVLGWGRKPQAEMPEGLSLDEARNFFIDKRLIPFAQSTAEHWLLTELPGIVQRASTEGFEWSETWGKLREYVRQRVIKKFASENRDVVQFLGANEELNDILERSTLQVVGRLPAAVRNLLPGPLTEALASAISDGAQRLLVSRIGK